MEPIDELIARLADLREGPGLLGEVAARGAAAVPGLEAMLRGRTDVVFQPRCLAAGTLGLIGGTEAIDALIRALDDALSRHSSPELNFAEQTVASRIARNLGGMRASSAMDLLLQGLSRNLLGCIDALASMPDQRAVEPLVDCLADDYARDPAMNTLRHNGSAAVAPLTRMVAHSSSSDEGHSSVRARASGIRLLGELNGPDAVLLEAVADQQPTVGRAAALNTAS
jgi:HEAT repeat protein